MVFIKNERKRAFHVEKLLARAKSLRKMKYQSVINIQLSLRSMFQTLMNAFLRKEGRKEERMMEIRQGRNEQMKGNAMRSLACQAEAFAINPTDEWIQLMLSFKSWLLSSKFSSELVVISVQSFGLGVILAVPSWGQ